jgi:hypothetical protein
MREPVDTKTADLLPACDLVGERPAKPTQRERTAARVAKYREKHGLAAMTVNVPAELLADFNAYLSKTGKARSDVVAHVLRTQVLRKR